MSFSKGSVRGGLSHPGAGSLSSRQGPGFHHSVSPDSASARFSCPRNDQAPFSTIEDHEAMRADTLKRFLEPRASPDVQFSSPFHPGQKSPISSNALPARPTMNLMAQKPKESTQFPDIVQHQAQLPPGRPNRAPHGLVSVSNNTMKPPPLGPLHGFSSGSSKPGLVSNQVVSGRVHGPKPTGDGFTQPPAQLSPLIPSPELPCRPDGSSPFAVGDLQLPSKDTSHRVNRYPVKSHVSRPSVQDLPVDPRPPALRPTSRGSNISKRRMNSSRISFPFRIDEKADLEKFSSAWNNYLQNHARRSENLAGIITKLEQKIEDYKHNFEEAMEKCRQQSTVIADLHKKVSDLSHQKHRLTEENEAAQHEISQNEEKRVEMQTKLRSYRAKLNQAISEQQDLYTRSKQMCDSTVSHLRKEHEEARMGQQEALEKLDSGMKKAADARGGMVTLLQEELKSSQAHNYEVDKENDQLKKDLADLQEKLKSEQSKVQDLLGQLEREGPARDHLQNLESKADEILLQLQQANSLLPANQKTHSVMTSKLDTLLEQMHALATDPSQFSSLKEAIEGLGERMEAANAQLFEDLGIVVEGQASMGAMSSNLESTIKDQLSSVNDLIKEQDERLLSKLQESDQKCQELTTRLSEKEGELRVAAERVEAASHLAAEKSQQVKTLDTKVQGLETLHQEKCRLEQENHSLRGQLEAKGLDDAAFRQQLESALASNEAKTTQLKSFVQEMTERLQAKVSGTVDLSSLREKMTSQLNAERDNLQQATAALNRCEEEKTRLKREYSELMSTKTKMARDLEVLSASRTEEKSSLERTQKSLVDAEQRIVNLKGRLKKSEVRTQEVKHALQQWAGKKEGTEGFQGDISGLDLEAMRSMMMGIMDAQRDSSAAKDCLLALLEMPNSPPLDSPTDSASDKTAENMPLKPSVLPSSGAKSADPLQTAAGDMAVEPSLDMTKEAVRRIVVRSPFEELLVAAPPSVLEERVTRRSASRPLSILKTASGMLGAPGLHPADRGRTSDLQGSEMRTRTKSMPPSHRHLRNQDEGGVAPGDLHTQVADLTYGIKHSLGLQRGSDERSGNERKRKNSGTDDGKPSKFMKTIQGMFGTLELEVGDLTSSYFPMPAASRPSQPVGGASKPPQEADELTPRNGSNINRNTGRATIARGPGSRERSRSITRTYSKKPQDTGAGANSQGA